MKYEYNSVIVSIRFKLTLLEWSSKDEIIFFLKGRGEKGEEGCQMKSGNCNIKDQGVEGFVKSRIPAHITSSV